MNICFIINDWSTMKPEKETSIRLVHEACSRGHTVGIVYARNMTIRDNMTYGFVQIIQPFKKVPEKMEIFHRKVQFREKLLPMNGFDAIFTRKNPPIDNIMLNFLDPIKDDVFILNDIDGIRKANNKIYTTSFYDPTFRFLPVTYVSRNKDYLLKVINESPFEKLILKPLDAYGGSGVIVLEKRARQNINSLLDFYINDRNFVIIQEYVEGAQEGDIRVLMLNGKAIGAYKRVPSDDDVRANIHAGGRAVKHTLTQEQKRICEHIGPKLVADGLFFCGVDLINDKLIEVNVISPGGIANINTLNRTRLQKKVIQFIEEKVLEMENARNLKQLALHRRKSFKEEINNAALED